MKREEIRRGWERVIKLVQEMEVPSLHTSPSLGDFPGDTWEKEETKEMTDFMENESISLTYKEYYLKT